MSASQQLLQLYTKNLQYFQEFYPDVYKKLANYQSSSKYELTIEYNSYFDIQDLQNGSYIYNTDSEAFSEQFVAQLLKNRQNQLSKKIIFGGTLLGMHIEKYLQVMDMDVCLILEPDLDIFRLSTFVVDYKQLTKNKIAFFSVNDSKSNLQNKINEFYFTFSQHNHNMTIASVYDNCTLLLEQAMQVVKDNIAFSDISKEDLNINTINNTDVEKLYTKAHSHHINKRYDQAIKLYKQIIYKEKLLKLDSEHQKKIKYIHHSYLNLGNLYQIQKEYVLAYYLYGKNVFAKNVDHKLYEASLAGFANIHDLYNTNIVYINSLLEKFLHTHPNSKPIKSMLISLYGKINAYQKANALLDEHQIPILPSIYNSQDQIDQVRKEFENKLDYLLQTNKTFSENDVRLTNFFYLANHNRNNKQIMSKLSKVYEKQVPSLCFKAKHCKKYKYKKDKKIKIGFVSNFFQSNHPVGKFINNTIINFDKNHNFNVFIYSFSKNNLEAKISSHTLLTGSLKEIRKIIANDKLDVIVYPEIGMHMMTYFLAHSRLAPIQCVLPGHPCTTGIKNIDYFLSYKHLETTKSQEYYSEQLIKLSNILSDYTKPGNIKSFHPKAVLKLEDNFNNYLIPTALQKLHPNFDNILFQITQNDPTAKLIFFELNSNNNLDRYIKERLLNCIHKKHISFRKWAKPDEFLSLLYHADAVLEPTVFGFGTTMMEALSIGTPIITLPGNTITSRSGQAFYKLIEVEDLIASNEEEYITLAIQIAQNNTYRDKMRKKILKNNHLMFGHKDIIHELTTFFKKKLSTFS